MRISSGIIRWGTALFFYGLLVINSPAETKPALRQTGVAKVDITPDYPIRLNGYLGRNAEATNAVQRIYAKALAIGSDKEGPAIFITLDNCIVPLAVRQELVQRLQKKAHIDPDRVALCTSHSHTAPFLKDSAPNIYGMDIPPADQVHIDRYTRELIDNLEKVCLAALKDRRPGNLAWGQTTAGFAANRRTKGGPVDHDLPFLTVTDKKGNLRAILANYACHCTTLGGDFTQICGDWAGYAMEYLEKDHPGVIVLMAIGCGADANPSPRPGLDLSKKHGQEITDAVNKSLGQALTPLLGKLECHARLLELPLDTPPTRESLENLAKQTNATGYVARKNLSRLDRGEKLETQVPFIAQTWNFGDDLAMVFLSGEVVVDYSLRLKKEFDPARMWVNGYANSVPGYIPSERILKEGGYEGGGAMMYYDHPTRFATGIEDRIISTIHEFIPKSFVYNAHQAEFPPAKSPQDSLAAMQTKPGFEIELVASEPLIESPVAIDWGPDGKLWVVEMRDYPMGMDGNWKPGGRIKYLEASHGDGKYDKATVVIDNIPFPTGVMSWRNGALVCTAPDILFVESGKKYDNAAAAKKLLTGFFTDNYQARVNGLSYGLDNWVYGANGLLGGVIHGMSNGKEVDIRGRDFRMNPDTGVFEPVSGLTQQGRVRNDWGDWFGCDNSSPVWHYPLPDNYVRRNPYIAAPSPRVYAASGDEPNLLHPISHLMERFNNPQSANRVTSGCGLGIYRDTILGDDFYGNAFLCEPVHNLVHRMQLKENGVTFSAPRAEDEQNSEFLASRDNWFRPVQARTGPDGALYVVDMYRFVIEHPRWIPADRLAQLDARAGADKGRVYRIYPKGKKLRATPNLRKLSPAKLVAALNTSNGMERDLAQIELVQRGDKSVVKPLADLAMQGKLPAIRIQALCTLDGLKALTPAMLESALADKDVHVRRQAIRLSETELSKSPAIQQAVLKLVDDKGVRFQLILSLGEWNDPRAGQALGKLAQSEMGDSWMRGAILSSAVQQPAEILKSVLAIAPSTPGRGETVDQLIATAVGPDNPETLGKVLAAVVPKDGQHIEDWQFSVLKSLLAALDRKKLTLASYATGANAETRDVVERIKPMFEAARKLAADKSAKESSREIAIRLLGHGAEHQDEDLQLLGELLKPANTLHLQKAALETLKYNRSDKVPGLLLADWKQLSPALRAPILEILLSREEFIKDLLNAVQAGSIQPNEISAANRQRLVKHSNPAIQKQAAAVLNVGANSSRAEVLAKYQSATTLSGDPSKGKPLFSKNCMTCHALKGQGFAVGPNLAVLADKPPGDFILAILDPNAVVEPRFVSYNIETKDERSLSGIVSAETATTLTLVLAGGLQEKILRSDVTEIKATGLSLMPEGFEQAMNPQDMADLIAYLKTSPAPFGSASEEKAASARKKFVADGINGVAKVVAASEDLPYPSWMGTLPLKHCRQTDGNSKVTWQSAPLAPDLKADGVSQFRLPAAMGYLSGPAGKFQLQLNGKTVLDFDVSLNDKTWQSKDGKVQMAYTVMENNNEDSNGVLSIEVANSLLEAGKPATFAVVGSATQSQRWFGLYMVSNTK
ncbi:MAG: putative rane-bound dehydrogenase [Pedosphaera sp.]|nr:putative rane-bound dehydrogenase [Pedosphaera sp.]